MRGRSRPAGRVEKGGPMRTDDPQGFLVRPMVARDLPEAARILVASGLSEEEEETSRRLQFLLEQGSRLCFVADRGGGRAGILLATFNGFHVFLSHIAVHEK